MDKISNLERKEYSVSYKILAIISISFVVGIMADRVILNAIHSENLEFSTTSLLAFFLTVIVSGASIVLSITAISLGKSSENAVVRRSDEGIRLQTELFTQTSDALRRIASSTGVTEKRIEDIIQGRAVDISSTLVESARSGKSQEEIESELKQSLLEERDSEAHVRRMLEEKERREKYKKFQSVALKEFSAKPDLVAEKMGDGSFFGEGIDLFDGVYRHGDQLVGVSVLWENVFRLTNSSDYLTRTARAIFENKIDKVYYVVLSEGGEKAKDIKENIDKILSNYKGEPQENISVLIGDDANISEKIQKIEI